MNRNPIAVNRVMGVSEMLEGYLDRRRLEFERGLKVNGTSDSLL